MQRSKGRTEQGLCLHFSGQYNRVARTDCADDKSSWEVGVFSMPGVRLFRTYIHCHCSRFIQLSVNQSQITCSRTVSSSQTITRLKTAFLSAQPLDIPPRGWNTVTSAVCSSLRCGRVSRLCLQNYALHLGCGDVADTTDRSGKTASESDCAMPCSGDPRHLCGGTFRLQLYFWNGNLNTWHVPANIGRYEVFSLSCHE